MTFLAPSYQINRRSEHNSSFVFWYPDQNKEERERGSYNDQGVGENIKGQGCQPSQTGIGRPLKIQWKIFIYETLQLVEDVWKIRASKSWHQNPNIHHLQYTIYLFIIYPTQFTLLTQKRSKPAFHHLVSLAKIIIMKLHGEG